MAVILIIQSSAVVRGWYREVLERAGYEVLEASRGLEGLHHCRQVPVDLVITDVQLPDWDGLELIGTIRQECSTVTILAVSIHDGPEDRLMTAQLLGANAILHDARDGQALALQVDL